ncbi:MAG TPA: biosynthetic peptidoglycan transglycosylase [Acidimicrobiales bacterium]|nr:biosynthetic peptidoglycan transglycosylase [Acidimicrobiales bacterium]
MALDLQTPTRPAAGPGRRSRRRRWLVRGLLALLAVIVVLASASAVLLVATPSPRSAPAKIAAELAAHQAPSDRGVIPAKVAAAILATEDSRYYSDPAIDLRGTLRAVYGIVTANPNEGGATIEVQLAKLLYTPRRSDPLALSEQVAIALKMDHDFSKRQILAMYLDAAYFGDGCYGITAAAERYFGRSPEQLSWGQASLLAGLVQAPSAFDPHHHLQAALRRRAHVLARLEAVGDLTATQVRAVAQEPLDPAVTFSG